jgi:hypothetical protein
MASKWFAYIVNNKVSNTLCVSRDAEDPAWDTLPPSYVETEHEIAIGSTYVNGLFTPPAAIVQPRLLSKFAFLRLLTPTEYALMFTQTDPMLVYGVACFNAAPDPFNIDDTLVTQMLDYCVTSGALTLARKTELWATMEAAST